MSIFRRSPRIAMDRGAALIFDWIREHGPIKTQSMYQLMSDPLGSVDPTTGRGKDAADTNMYLSRALPAPQGFLVGSLHCFYGTMRPDDRELFRENYMLEFLIEQRIYYKAPLVAIPFEGVILPCDGLENKPGVPDQPGDFRERPPYIASLQQFYIRLIGKPVTLKDGLRFCPVINGAQDWPIQ